MIAEWNFPTRILFGEGLVTECGAKLLELGASRALIVSDQGVLESGIVDDVGKSLRKAKIPFEIFAEVSSNPGEVEAYAASEAYGRSQADSIVAIGGGSVIDVAKLVRLLASHPRPLERYIGEGAQAEIHAAMPPLIALPTTAGTGSEVGRSAVYTQASSGRKTVVFSPRLLPDLAILDPQLSLSMPPHISAATGFDAFTHCVESYCALGDHPMADAIALAGMDLVARHLESAVQEGQDIHARGAMLKAAMMGAVAFQKGLGACHALAHPLSAEYGLHHGLANALCLPAVLDFNRSAIPAKIARIAGAIGVKGDNVDTLAFECAGGVRALRRKAGLPEGLREVGIDEEALPKLARLAYEDAAHGSNPRPCTVEDMMSLYRASL